MLRIKYQDIIVDNKKDRDDLDLKPTSHFNKPIDKDDDDRLTGLSRHWGDADEQTQRKIIDRLIDESKSRGLTPRQAAHLLAITQLESGFNPDAADRASSAAGLSGLSDDRASFYGIGDDDRFDVDDNINALCDHYQAVLAKFDHPDFDAEDKLNEGEIYALYQEHRGNLESSHAKPEESQSLQEESEQNKKFTHLLDRFENAVRDAFPAKKAAATAAIAAALASSTSKGKSPLERSKGQEDELEQEDDADEARNQQRENLLITMATTAEWRLDNIVRQMGIDPEKITPEAREFLKTEFEPELTTGQCTFNPEFKFDDFINRFTISLQDFGLSPIIPDNPFDLDFDFGLNPGNQNDFSFA